MSLALTAAFVVLGIALGLIGVGAALIWLFSRTRGCPTIVIALIFVLVPTGFWLLTGSAALFVGILLLRVFGHT